MNDTDLYLLDHHGVIVLPESIDHDAYRHVLEALHRAGSKPLTIYCDGDGGYGRNALSIAGLIQQHGNVTGILAFEAHSCHADVFMACQKRYVHPAAAIGIHMTAYSHIDKSVDRVHARNINAELERGECQIARIYAQACPNPEHDETYWFNRLQETGSAGVQMIDADQLIQMGIARPIAKWSNAQRANGSQVKLISPLSIYGEGPGEG
jgi:ATP-dependent protease ClpP protease subunit